MSVTITYPSVAEMERFANLLHPNLRGWCRERILHLVAAPLSLLAVGIVLAAFGVTGTREVLWLVAGGAAGEMISRRTARLMRRRAASPPGVPPDSRYTVRLSASGMATESEVGHAEWSWRAVTAVTEEPSGIAIWIGPATLVVPAELLPPGTERADFAATVRGWWTAANREAAREASIGANIPPPAGGKGDAA